MPFSRLFASGSQCSGAPEADAAIHELGEHDPGLSVEPLSEFVKLLTAPEAAFIAGDRPPAAGQPMPGAAAGRWPYAVEQPYRPVNRPPTALLTILDDGNATTGETVRLRGPVCLIGRTEGSVVIPHDHKMSSRHAEIIRDGTKPPYAWYLRDVGSTNGTFVCCDSAPLRPDRLLILGTRRFRLHLPHATPAPPSAGNAAPDTRGVDSEGVPMLVETTVPANPICIRLVGSRVAVGRPGFDNHVEIDDPLLGTLHAVFTQAANGTWWVDAMPSRNGVWIQVRSVELADSCRFQCGEQRFVFVRP